MKIKFILAVVLFVTIFATYQSLSGLYFGSEISKDRYYEIASIVKHHPSVAGKIKNPDHVTNSEYFKLIKYAGALDDKSRLSESKQALANRINETK